jgi:hypothetical protein
MTGADPKLSAIDKVRRTVPSLAARSAAAALAEVPEATAQRVERLSKQLAGLIVQGILDSIDGHPAPAEPQLPPGTAMLSPGLVREVSRIATNATWTALVDAVPLAERDLLLGLAQQVFDGAHEIQEAALHLPGPGLPAENSLARVPVAYALIRGDNADGPAARLGVPLTTSYVVAVVDARLAGGERPLSPWPELEVRSDVPAAVDGAELVVMLPALRGLSRSEVISCASALTENMPEGTAVGAVAAADRAGVPDAAAQARLIVHAVRSLGYAGGVYQMDDVPVEVSLMRSPDLARLLAGRLVPLHASGAPLLETLRVYLETSQDRRQAASALHIHSNTLDYRLRRIRELTGLSPTVPRDIQILGTALMAWRLQQTSDTLAPAQKA